jgi:hypothetical protein
MEVVDMCVSCGCGKPNEKHGDDRHITMDQLQRAADAAGIPVSKAGQNVVEAIAASGGQQPSSRQTA